MKHVKVILSHKGRLYEIDGLKFEDTTDDEVIEFMLDEGNLCDDGSRSEMIREHCDPNFPILPSSGDEIDLESVEIH